jgi:membrane-associated phospholipid phosphatase
VSSRITTLLWGFATVLVVLPAHADDEPAAETLHWDHPRFSLTDYVVTGSAGAITLTAAIVAPLPRHVTWRNGFDEGIRNALRLGGSNARYIARDGSDVGLSLVATWPIFVDSLATAWWYRGSREVAQEMALIDLETMAIAGAAQGVTNVVVSRERPYVRDCGGSLPADIRDCDGTTRDRSFFSGHSTFSFASASLICVHHVENDLLGSPYDALSCVMGYAVAASTATLRVLGDMHFATDVLTGALVGTAVGWGIPLLHYRTRHSLAPAPGAEGVQLRVVPSAGGAMLTGTF